VIFQAKDREKVAKVELNQREVSGMLLVVNLAVIKHIFQSKNKRITLMKKLLFLLAGLMLFVVTSTKAQMQIPKPHLQVSVVSSMMNSWSVALNWPDVYAAIYTLPDHYNVYKKKGAIADTGKFEMIWITREGKFMDHNVSLGKSYSYYIEANYRNQPEVFSDTVQVLVIEANDIIAKVNGVVVDESTLIPLKRAKIEFLPVSFMAGPPSWAITDSIGSFNLKLRPGDYFIFTGAEGYVPEFYDNAQTMQQAAKVTLKSGDLLTFNFGLKQLLLPDVFSVTGTVKDASGNAQKALVTAVITNRRPNHMPDPRGHSFIVRTDESGNFKLFARENDTLVLFVDPTNHALQRQFYNNKTTFETADRIVVTQDITGIDITLASKAVYDNSISGTITDSATSSPLKAIVYAYKKKSNMHQGSRSFVLSDSLTGSYSLANLEPGTYYLVAASRGYRPTFFNYDGTQTLNWRNADSIIVTENGKISDINFALRKINAAGNAIVYGNILDANGNNVEGAVASLLNDNGEVVNATISDLDGSFIMEGLSSGSYQLSSSVVDYNTSDVNNVTVESANNYVNVDLVLTTDGVTSVEVSKNIVTNYALSQNYPNPFNPSTLISYQLPASGLVTIKVYNVIGKEIATLVNEYQQSGNYSKEFSANRLTSGVYFYTIKSGSFSATKKMILMK